MGARERKEAPERPLISVIVPVYNIREYLSRCVQSLQRQTWQELEILLVDDGSTDGTGELCDALAAEDDRIRVLHKENGGTSSARNLGIEQARGEYLGFVDSDDYVEPDMYRRLYQAICGKEDCLVQVGRDEVDEQGKQLPSICEIPEKEQIFSPEEFLKELLLHRGDCSFCTKLVSRRLLGEDRFPEKQLNEDFHLMLRLLQRTEGVLSLPVCGYHVFYRLGSNTRKKQTNDFSRVFADNVHNADLALELTAEKYPQLQSVAVRFGLYQRLDYLLHIPISRMGRDNQEYRSIVRFLRRHVPDTVGSPYLTKKNKLYLLLLTAAPKTVRRVHHLRMQLRKK
ncbi:MAG: glycosyltransferase family 2 protein [Lachnospiraceae bacterium]|nr:glycosyltransferase family 2 protein [Lachnospiraceae bacterium]